MVHSGLTSRKAEYKIITGIEPEVQTAHAILLRNGKYVLQLKDDKPNISAPRQWSLFGGMADKGETPLDVIRREIHEELSIEPKQFVPLWPIDYYDPYDEANIRTWFFWADVLGVWPQHQLNEGREVGDFSFEELSSLEIPSVMRLAVERFHKEMTKAL